MKSWLEKMTQKYIQQIMKENLLLLKRFTRTLENKIYKYMTSISINVYIDILDDIINKYNNSYHSTFKMKIVDVK